jgi:hypothetical protein
MSATLGYFEQLCFTAHRYDDGYGFVHRHAIELHHSLTTDLDPVGGRCRRGWRALR